MKPKVDCQAQVNAVLGGTRCLILALLFLTTMTTNAQNSGVIGKLMEDELPVIYVLDTDVPDLGVTSRYPWLTVISWKYDKTRRNGMPPELINNQMIQLEDALSEEFLVLAGAHWAYNRTGNGLKKFAYYIKGRERFSDQLNKALADHQRYPIEIDFYVDSAWTDYLELVDIFSESK